MSFRIEDDLTGAVVKDATPSSWITRSPTKNQNGFITGENSSEAGLISYSINGIKKSIAFYPKDCEMRPRVGDKVRHVLSNNPETFLSNVFGFRFNSALIGLNGTKNSSLPIFKYYYRPLKRTVSNMW